MWEEVLFVVEGEGYDLHWDLKFDCIDAFEWEWAPEPKKFEWQRGNFIYVPPFTIHQHFNNANATSEARLIVISNHGFRLVRPNRKRPGVLRKSLPDFGGRITHPGQALSRGTAPLLPLPACGRGGRQSRPASLHDCSAKQTSIAANRGGVDAHDLLQREPAQVVRAAGLRSGCRTGRSHRTAGCRPPPRSCCG